MKYLLRNKTRQGINLTLKSAGKHVAALLPASSTREITAEEMTQDVLDKSVKGYIEYDEIHEPKVKEEEKVSVKAPAFQQATAKPA